MEVLFKTDLYGWLGHQTSRLVQPFFTFEELLVGTYWEWDLAQSSVCEIPQKSLGGNLAT